MKPDKPIDLATKAKMRRKRLRKAREWRQEKDELRLQRKMPKGRSGGLISPAR